MQENRVGTGDCLDVKARNFLAWAPVVVVVAQW